MSISPPQSRRPIVMHVPAGTTVSIGNDIQIEIRGAHRNRTKLHVYAPSSLNVDREVNFIPDYTVKNEDGPSAPTPEPSAIKSAAVEDNGN